jgi:outer membrane protein with beta-barrel domain
VVAATISGVRKGLRLGSPLRAFFFLAVLFPSTALSHLAYAELNELKAGRWSGGGGLGFMADTPDGVAEFAFNGHADYFVADAFSVGPLAQYAGVGNDFLIGVSLQGRYWWNIPGMGDRTKLVLQGGIGFIRAGIKDTDSHTANTYGSFLIPVGIGLDYPVTERLALTADFLVNFTSLGETIRANGQEFDLHTNVMPAFYLGVRF